MNNNTFILNMDKDWSDFLSRSLVDNQRKAVRQPNQLSVSVFSESGECVLSKPENQSFQAEDFSVKSPGGKVGSNIGIINVRGALSYSHSILQELFGGASYEQISKAISALANDASIGTIILKIQSPGGSAIGASEISKQLFEVRQQKRVIAFADPYAFSAAYQIATAAERFYTIPSGSVGSVGTYVQHVEYSEMLKNDGIKVSYIFAGDKKVDGNSVEPLSERAKADLQSEVDELYQMFMADVARNRNVSVDYVKENFGQGGTVSANKALSANMIDGILTFDELLKAESLSLQKTAQSLKSKALLESTKEFLQIEEL